MENSLYHSDCFNIFPLIKDKSIDLIFADLPYGMTKAKWDTPLDLNKLWVQYKRIIKDNGCILLFAGTPFDKILGASNIKMLKYEWIWEKTQATGYLNAKKMPLKAHENILVFYKKPPIYNPQKTTGHKPINNYTKKAKVQNKTELYGKIKIDISGGGETDRYPRSVLKFKTDKQKNKLDGTIHPTQKPLELIKYMLRTYTNENSLVLDNVAGSGTVGLGCKELNRKFILIEKEEKYIDITCKRLNYDKNKVIVL